ncbi:MAG: conjugal transfer protein TraC, partial [Dictyoglomus turgidum]
MLNGIGTILGLVKSEDEKATLTYSEIRRDLGRSKFSNYLMPRAYSDELKVFYCEDDTIGFMFECVPVLVFDTQSLKNLEGLFRVAYPEKTVVQIILYADPDIKDYLDYYENTKPYAPDVIKQAYKRLREFYEKQTTGNPPIRNFRSFITVKMPASAREISPEFLKEVTTQVEEVLRGCHLSPRLCDVGDYLKLMRQLLNFRLPENPKAYCTATSIDRQVILANTEIEVDTTDKCIKITDGDRTRYFRAVTVKSLPAEIDFFWVNRVTGSYEGMVGDTDQINTPFMFVLNVVIEDLKAKLHAKANLALHQQALGSFIVSLRR